MNERIKEIRRKNAANRSRKANMKPKKQRSESDLARLERYNFEKILFRKFSL